MPNVTYPRLNIVEREEPEDHPKVWFSVKVGEHDGPDCYLVAHMKGDVALAICRLSGTNGSLVPVNYLRDSTPAKQLKAMGFDLSEGSHMCWVKISAL